MPFSRVLLHTQLNAANLSDSIVADVVVICGVSGGQVQRDQVVRRYDETLRECS